MKKSDMKLLNLNDYLSPEELLKIDYICIDNFLRDLVKDGKYYPFSIINQWVVRNNTKDTHWNIETYTCLKMVDEDTYYSMYSRLFNPLDITITEKKSDPGKYTLSCMLYSIDDAAYGFTWKDIDRLEVDRLIPLIISWVDSVDKEFSAKSLVEFGLSIGAEDSSW